MKVSVMPWHVFWEASGNQDPAPPDGWLQRWAFADDGVGALVRSQARDRKGSGQPAYIVEQAELELPLDEAPSGKITTHRDIATRKAEGKNGNNGNVLIFNPN